MNVFFEQLGGGRVCYLVAPISVFKVLLPRSERGAQQPTEPNKEIVVQ